jgi:spoIIIJ-associated protein
VVEWVEVRGKSVDVAVAAAMHELGISEREAVEVEIIQEPEKGFLGLGGRDAIVRVKPRSPGRKRRRKKGGREDQAPSGVGRTSRQGNGRSQRPQGERRPPGNGGRGGGERNRSSQQPPRRPNPQPESRPPRPERASTADPHAQAPMVGEFLHGLVDAFGLDGRVSVEVDDDVIVATVEGEQTEALVGPRGSVLEAVHEITKTVLHRQVEDTARLRLDIAGYADRRRQALSIYASQLIEQVLNEGGEIMLEPMGAADRKVIHDAVAEREGVRSYSEGEAPRRYVVIAAIDDEEPAANDSNGEEPVDEPDVTGSDPEAAADDHGESFPD